MYYLNRWWVVPVALGASICCGVSFGFSIFSPTLKRVFGLSQTQLNTVGVVGNVGQFMGLGAGMFYDRFGPRPTLLLAGVLGFTGFGALYLSLRRVVDVGFVSLMAIFFVGCHAQCWFDTACCVTLLTNFASLRGTAAGLIKAFQGISSGLMSVLFIGFFKPRPSIYNIMAYI